MTVIIYNESLLGAGTPVFTLVPDTLYHLLPLEKLCTNPKYSVVTKIPGVPFSNENSSYSLRCSTFVQNINWPSDAFYNEGLQRSIYEIMRSVNSVNIHDSIIIDTIAHNTTGKNILNTTFNNVFNNIIDSATAVNKSAREIIYNASANVHQINKAVDVTHDTIAHASTNITTNATKVIIPMVLVYMSLISVIPTRLYLPLTKWSLRLTMTLTLLMGRAKNL